MVPREGAYEVTLAEPMEETCYLDAASLVTWDLPPGWASSSSGWAARVDARSGHTYYFFPPTGETTWTLPER